MANWIRTASTLGALALLAGCAGTNGALPPGNPAAGEPSFAGTQQTEDVSGDETGGDGILFVRIRVPKAAADGARYVSPATKGMTIAFHGRKRMEKTLLTLVPNKHCKSTAAALLCNFAFALPAGRYHATVDTYDRPPVATAKSPTNRATPRRGEPRTRDGKNSDAHATEARARRPARQRSRSSCPARSLEPHSPNQSPSTSAHLDADGFTIVGTYEKAIALADSDASGATSIAVSGKGTSGELLASSDIAGLSYTGLADHFPPRSPRR